MNLNQVGVERMEKGIEEGERVSKRQRNVTTLNERVQQGANRAKSKFFLAALAHLIYLTIMGRRRYSEQEKKDDRPRDRIPY